MAFFEFPHTRTYDSDLGWLIRHCKNAADAISVLESWKDSTQATIDDLQQLIDDIESNNFPENIANAIKAFIVKNFYDIIGDMTAMVFFGLTDTGYFVAYIPESWNDITFNTTEYDITISCMTEYGHLVLSY